MIELSGQGTARLGSGFLTERLKYTDEFEWYRLEPQLEFNDRNRKVGTAQLLCHPWQTYASSRFREVVEGEGLTGLVFGPPSFEPMRGDSRSWFGCRSSALPGRGLDHDWAPPSQSFVKEGIGRLGADQADNDTAASTGLIQSLPSFAPIPAGPTASPVVSTVLGWVTAGLGLRGPGEHNGHRGLERPQDHHQAQGGESTLGIGRARDGDAGTDRRRGKSSRPACADS